VEDVFSKLEATRRHWVANGIGSDAVEAIVR
jgi:hypothetical protein